MHQTVCQDPGCQRTAPKGERYCDKCRDKAQQREAQQKREWEQQRGTSGQRGYDYRWQLFRKSYLTQHPLCVLCSENGEAETANEIHHEKPIATHPELQYDETNLMALCKSCHNSISPPVVGGD